MFQVDYITNSVFNSRTYILSEIGSDSVLLVDCGDIEPIMERIGGRNVDAVLLTHAHFDHIYGLPVLLEKFPDVLIYTNEWGKRALADDKLNMSRYHENPVRVVCANVRDVREGDNLFGFEVFETPGHNPSCVCYADKEVIFTGDAYIPGCKVVTNLPHGDKEASSFSMKVINSIKLNRIVCPGHSV